MNRRTFLALSALHLAAPLAGAACLPSAQEIFTSALDDDDLLDGLTEADLEADERLARELPTCLASL